MLSYETSMVNTAFVSVGTVKNEITTAHKTIIKRVKDFEKPLIQPNVNPKITSVKNIDKIIEDINDAFIFTLQT